MVYLQRCLIVTWLVSRETAAISASSVYTIQPCTMSRHFMHSYIRKMNACLVVTCHPHFWQNDRDLLRATAVTRGWDVHRNKSQHRKLTLEKKFSRRSCRDSNLRPFDQEPGTLTTEPPSPLRCAIQPLR